jgi:hypothetical protein
MFRGLVLKIVLGYGVKTTLSYHSHPAPFLSPFDYEHIVLTGYALQPEITPSGIHGDPCSLKPLSAGAVYT